MNIIDTLQASSIHHTLVARYHTSSKISIKHCEVMYTCGEGFQAYREYFVSFSMHCTIVIERQIIDTFIKEKYLFIQ